MIETLLRFNPSFDRVIESPIKVNQVILGWQTSCLLRDGTPLGSGTKESRDEARRIACSEFIERSFFLNPIGHKDSSWCFDRFPSACGLAVGFEKDKTIVRSIVEATERWTMTNWILRKKTIPLVTVDLPPLATSFLEPFNSIKTYFIQIPVLISGSIIPVHVAFLMAYTENGVFFGSNASTEPDDLWTHACVESFRHWLVVKNGKNTNKFPHDRVFYFAENRAEADAQIPDGDCEKWNVPQLNFFHHAEISEGIFAARSIMEGYVPWTSGPLNQFLY